MQHQDEKLHSELILAPKNTTFTKQWFGRAVEKNMLIDLFKWFSRKERSSLRQVSRETVDLISDLDLLEYCDLVNRQIKKTSGALTLENTLTITRLKEHWQFGDQALRLLVNLRFNVIHHQALPSCYDVFLTTLDDPTKNGYLKNPFLRDLIILLLIAKNQKERAVALLPLDKLEVKLHDPSAICLYSQLLDSEKFQYPLWQYFHSMLELTEHSEVTLLLIESLRYQMYLYPERIASFITKLLKLNPKLYPEAVTFENITPWLKKATCFMKIPSAEARKWLLACDLETFEAVLQAFIDIYQEDYDVSFWDDLTKQLHQMTLPEIKLYLLVYDLSQAEKYELGDIYEQRMIKSCKEFSKLPVDFIRKKLDEIPEFTDEENQRNYLRLFLNTRLKYFNQQVLTTIFYESVIYTNKEGEDVNNLEIFSIRLDEECINFITSNAHFSTEGKTTLEYLGACNGGQLYNCFSALALLCDSELSFLLTERILYLHELVHLSGVNRYRFVQIVQSQPKQELVRALIVRILSCLPTIAPQIDYISFLTKQGLEEYNELDLTKFILLTNSAAILKSVACAQLMKRVGLKNFLSCSSMLVNYIPMLTYVESIFENAKDKFEGLLKVIQDGYDNNDFERLPQLISTYLFPSDSPTLSLGKRSLKDEDKEGPLAKLYRTAKEDPELAQRLLDEGERYSSAAALQR